MYIISGCLLGMNCKYSGKDNFDKKVMDFARKHSFMPVCPEVLGQLGIPRPPMEIRQGRVVTEAGLDVTDKLLEGCRVTYETAVKIAQQRGEKIEGAILKARSPSCGKGEIYDGTFSHQVVPGDGVFTTYLKGKGIRVITEESL